MEDNTKDINQQSSENKEQFYKQKYEECLVTIATQKNEINALKSSLITLSKKFSPEFHYQKYILMDPAVHEEYQCLQDNYSLAQDDLLHSKEGMGSNIFDVDTMESRRNFDNLLKQNPIDNNISISETDKLKLQLIEQEKDTISLKNTCEQCEKWVQEAENQRAEMYKQIFYLQRDMNKTGPSRTARHRRSYDCSPIVSKPSRHSSSVSRSTSKERENYREKDKYRDRNRDRDRERENKKEREREDSRIRGKRENSRDRSLYKDRDSKKYKSEKRDTNYDSHDYDKKSESERSKRRHKSHDSSA
ncbi:hypothetical protein WA158_001835 [Blastocystis sp. Blastoise]